MRKLTPTLTLTLGLMLLCIPCHAVSWRALWHFTQGTLVIANAADAGSSYGKRELNPALGHGQFGARQIGIKFGIAGVVIAVESLGVHRAPRAAKSFTILNLLGAGAVAAVAVRNERIH